MWPEEIETHWTGTRMETRGGYGEFGWWWSHWSDKLKNNAMQCKTSRQQADNLNSNTRTATKYKQDRKPKTSTCCTRIYGHRAKKRGETVFSLFFFFALFWFEFCTSIHICVCVFVLLGRSREPSTGVPNNDGETVFFCNHFWLELAIMKYEDGWTCLHANNKTGKKEKQTDIHTYTQPIHSTHTCSKTMKIDWFRLTYRIHMW